MDHLSHVTGCRAPRIPARGISQTMKTEAAWIRSASQMWRRREHGQVLLEYGKVASIKSAIDFRERIERCIKTADNGVLVLARRTNSDLVIACGVQKIDQAASASVWSILRGLHHPYSRAWLTSDRLLPPSGNWFAP
jgi:hypothetical protein